HDRRAADAERKAEHRGRGEPSRAEHPARGESKVVEHGCAVVGSRRSNGKKRAARGRKSTARAAMSFGRGGASRRDTCLSARGISYFEIGQADAWLTARASKA